MAWLHATPVHKGKNSSQKKSRISDYIDRNGHAPEMPEPDFCGHLIEDLQEVGPVLSGSQGPVALTYSEISAWMQSACVELTPWEARTIHHLSRVYVSQYSRSSEPSCPRPWSPPSFDRDEIATGIKSMFGTIRNQQQRNRSR